MIESELSKRILTNDLSRRMVKMVSPIYQESYIGLWLFEVIGREYEDMRQIVDEYMAQLNPETATWGLELWERRYGIITDFALSYAQRRELLATQTSQNGPFLAKHAVAIAESITERIAWMDDNTGPYMSTLWLQTDTDDLDKIVAELNRRKPAHWTIEIKIWRFAWSELDARNKTWAYLDAANLSWDEFEIWRER